ncbi:hypothetical protein ANANG_G00001720 [Anguilla anguilla]|uniref:Tectonin beta-propeller repeat containing 2 n=1 Tax=Anguilla anguilla TaxID=7936 RepID=A0A9D3MW22_ANGAN|nr:hypothetical protein ANANG_G00001720 [Anguilla anguilla]
MEGCGDIVSVSCTENEIFILKGDRDIIRIATRPEGLATNLSELSLRLSSPSPPPPCCSRPLAPWKQPSQSGPWPSLVSRRAMGRSLGRSRGRRWERRWARAGSSCWRSWMGASHAAAAVRSPRGTAPWACPPPASRPTCPPPDTAPSPSTSCSRSWSSRPSRSRRRANGADRRVVTGSRRTAAGRRGCSVRMGASSPDLHSSDSISGDSHGNDPFTLLTSPDPAPSATPTSSVMPPPATPPPELVTPPPELVTPPPELVTPPSEVVTPDVDSLLQCTFAYMQAAAEQEEATALPSEGVSEGVAEGVVKEEEEEEEEEEDRPHPEAPQPSCPPEPEIFTSSDEEDIYAPGVPHSASSASLDTPHAPRPPHPSDTPRNEDSIHKSHQLAESWMDYAGPGCGILSLVVTERHIWCLDFKGGLYCSALPNSSLNWQRFEDSVQQVAVSPQVEQKTNKAFACGKVSIKGKRHWYEAMTQTAFVALSDDAAWIIRTDGDLYLQTGLSVERPCSRARALFYRDGLSTYCTEGEQWRYDTVSERQGLEPVCIALGERGTVWALDGSGNLWFRTGVTAAKPQGDDEHWWQVSITDYVVFDQCGLFQTLIQATQSVAVATRAPVERVADRLRVAFWSQQPQCQPSLISANRTGVWIASGRNDFHVTKGSLVGSYWESVVPRGTASVTKWAFIFSSSSPTKEGSFLWVGQSRRDLFCIWDGDAQLRPSTVQLPAEVEMVQLTACRDAVWGLDWHGRIHIRTLSPNCPSGLHWTRLDLSQLGHVRLVSISCGSQHVWACDGNGMVYFRVGTQPLNPSMMLPAWICIEPPEQPVGVHLVSVHTSPNDRMLWAVDSRANVHVRTGITEEMPVGTDWEHIPGLQASQLVLSLRTVWVLCPSGDIARRYGVTDKNPAGDYWKKTPGLVTCLTVSPDDELWALSQSGSLIHRLTKTFLHGVARSKVSAGSVGEDLEDEWEVI